MFHHPSRSLRALGCAAAAAAIAATVSCAPEETEAFLDELLSAAEGDPPQESTPAEPTAEESDPSGAADLSDLDAATEELLYTSDDLDALAVEPEGDDGGYDRGEFSGWVDGDGSGCDTREEVLAAWDETGGDCGDGEGTWTSAFDGETVHDPSEIDIDHMVPLAEAWRSGADEWDQEQRDVFATDPQILIPVTAGSNRSKGDQDPASWRPPEESYTCSYALAWIGIKLHYDLSADPAEHDALADMLQEC